MNEKVYMSYKILTPKETMTEISVIEKFEKNPVTEISVMKKSKKKTNDRNFSHWFK